MSVDGELMKDVVPGYQLLVANYLGQTADHKLIADAHMLFPKVKSLLSVGAVPREFQQSYSTHHQLWIKSSKNLSISHGHIF